MPNRLARETSPYLQQHAENPVDWYPWGPEAMARAAAEDKPIMLSVGYAACHWCHVMAHESFEDPATAAVMNERFINVKVDREERPDVDSVYMRAVQAMTGHGGWPMTVFLTPTGEPFYGGTYFPPEDRHGMPSFVRVLTAISDSYRNQRGRIDASAASVRRVYDLASSETGSAPTRETLDHAYSAIASEYDSRDGGFGGAPKFPPTMTLEFLLTRWARLGDQRALEMAHSTFLHMARGGIYDQIGGGFARYSVDAHWMVPHFEKMLYDNALLVRFGAHLWQATKDPEVQRVTLDTIAWLAREMTAPEGGFFSSLDADSEGEEGKFYVWSIDEMSAVLGESVAIAQAHWGATRAGNFEGANILHVARPIADVAATRGISESQARDEIALARARLRIARDKRVRPARDQKVLAMWNGLMIRALGDAALIFGDASAGAAALAAAEFVASAMIRDGRVLRSYKDGNARIAGFLEDYASLGLAFVSVYALTFDARWLTRATEIGARMVDLFWDADSKMFFDTASDAEPLITRPRDVTDNALPSGHSLAVELLATLADYTGDESLGAIGVNALSSVSDTIARYPQAFGHLLTAADAEVFGATEVVLAGERSDPALERLRAALASRYVPSLRIAHAGDDVAFARDREVKRDSDVTVCRRGACSLPTADPAALEIALSDAVRA